MGVCLCVCVRQRSCPHASEETPAKVKEMRLQRNAFAFFSVQNKRKKETRP
jgi:hypothetical protein